MVLVRHEASEGIEPLREVVGHEEGVDVRFELGVRALMVTLNRRLLEGFGSSAQLDHQSRDGLAWSACARYHWPHKECRTYGRAIALLARGDSSADR